MVLKEYVAVVEGVPADRTGEVTAPLVTRKGSRSHSTPGTPGKEARTRYSVVRSLAGERSLVTASIDTGRTHQIRAHLAHLGCPLIGDPLYGKQRALKAVGPHAEEADAAVRAFPRQALHAAVLGFKHPVTGEDLRFESPLPGDMQALLDVLRRL